MRSILCISPLLLLAACPAPDDPKPGDTDEPHDTADTAPDETWEHAGGTIGDETWSRGVHLVRGEITVTGVLTVEACAELRMDPDTRFVVRDGGALRWIGEEDCPIVVRSGKDAPAPGDWSGLELHATGSGDNELRWVELSHAGQGYGAVWMEGGASLAMRDSTVTRSGDVGLFFEDGAELRDFTGNTVVDNVGAPLRVAASGIAALGEGTYLPNGELGIEVVGAQVTEDATWRALGVPLDLVGGLFVWSDAGSAHLTVEEGVELRVGAEQVIAVGPGGGLALLGTPTAPVLVTSASPAPAPGDWYGVEIAAGSDTGANVFTNAVVAYGGGGWDHGAVWVDTGASLAMTDSTVRQSGHFGLELAQGAELRAFTGNTLVDNARGPVRLHATEVHMLGAGTYGPNEEAAIEVRWGSIGADATWIHPGVPYAAPDGFEVEPTGGAATLTIGAGAIVEMGRNTLLSVGRGASLVLDGTAAAPVVFTSSDASPSAGDWAEIDLWDTGNVFRHAELRYAGSDGYGAIWLDTDASVTLDNVRFTEVATCDVSGNGGVAATETSFAHCDW